MQYRELVGDWEEAPYSAEGGFPVEHKQYIENVRANCLLDLPNLSVSRDHDKIMVMVCGGPTARLYLEDIRKKAQDDQYVIFTSNKTHDWLIDNGIIPDYDFVIDPKPSKIKDVQNPRQDVHYLIGMGCDHKVFLALEGYKVTRVFTVSGIGNPTDVDVIRALFPYQDICFVGGGTMAGLRAMSLADVMGFLTVEYYGFDSCYFDRDENGKPIYYSYDKKRTENIMEAQTADGRTFLTSPVFASQARQFLKWKHRYEWIKFIIHGDSLTAAINEIDDEQNRPKHKLLITDYARELQKQDHLEDDINSRDPRMQYGTVGHTYAGHVSVLAGKIIKRNGSASMLDYGCGKRSLEQELPPIMGLDIRAYDPCIDGLDDTPEPADLVVCTDVLEHVEPECLDNVLDDLSRVTKELLFLSVSTRPARNAYSDGHNRHKIVQDHEWWRPKIRKRFDILDTQIVQNDKFMCVCQAKAIGR